MAIGNPKKWLHSTHQPVYTFLMQSYVVQRPPRQGLLPEKIQHPATKTANSGLARVYYGVQYLDGKTSRWISADPAMGEYIPQAPVNDEAKKYNKNLPGMGGVYNTVNMHVYHYAGNNPVKLVDPDGETPRSYKIVDVSASEAAGRRIECYKFTSSGSTLDGAAEVAFSGLIPLGGLVASKINSKFGFKNITGNDGLSKLKNIISITSSVLNKGKYMAKILKLPGDVGKILSKIAGPAGVISNILTAFDVGSELFKAEDVGMDNMIENLLGSALVSKTHEGLSALYLYAKHEMLALRESGDLKYETDGTGRITGYSITQERINSLKEELRIMQAVIDQ